MEGVRARERGGGRGENMVKGVQEQRKRGRRDKAGKEGVGKVD